MMSRPDTCDWSDVQALVRSGHRALPFATYLVFGIVRPAEARAFLADLWPLLTTADAKAEQRALHVALSYAGIRTLLAIDDGGLSSFPLAFAEGIAGSLHRSRVLGDVGCSSPGKWYWGGTRRAAHGLLVLYHHDSYHLANWVNELRRRSGASVTWMTEIDTARDTDREAFGFRDGLSQPLIEGSHAAREHPDSRHLVRLGEILLGYEDNAGIESPVPSVPGVPDFGVNGTYLIARQITQHYDAFWRFLREKSAPLGMSAEDLGARIIGRTMDGDVLVPGGPPRPAALGNEFDFSADRNGHGCPLGAHIRRGNPRDMLATGKNADDSWRIVNRHRVLRRGRSYGPQGWRALADPAAPVNEFTEPGLMFVGLNADIERQFEFVQQNWINDPGFAELAGERDPLIGTRNGGDDVFTVAGTAVRTRVSGLPDFVTVKGGEYFFLPGRRGLGRLVGACR
jgi:Dyp-type peroxidase family